MLSIHYGGCISETIGLSQGIAEQELSGLELRLRDARTRLEQQDTAGKLGFMNLPNDVRETRSMAAWARGACARFDTAALLGIGGSALGPDAGQRAGSLLRPGYEAQRDELDALAQKYAESKHVL